MIICLVCGGYFFTGCIKFNISPPLGGGGSVKLLGEKIKLIRRGRRREEKREKEKQEVRQKGREGEDGKGLILGKKSVEGKGRAKGREGLIFFPRER